MAVDESAPTPVVSVQENACIKDVRLGACRANRSTSLVAPGAPAAPVHRDWR